MAYLEGKNLVASYGVVPILHECSVEVEKGELAVIVGPNGAGKSTVMRVLLGMLDATSGSVTLDGNDISTLSTQDRIVEGLGFVPQTKNVFPSMTVEENLQMGGAEELKLLDEPSPDGKTALHLTTELKDTETTILLLDHGANPNLKDADSNTPLHTVCHMKDIKTATNILEKNGMFLTNHKSQTPDIGGLIFEHRERREDVEKMMRAVGQSNHRKEILEEILRKKNLLFKFII